MIDWITLSIDASELSPETLQRFRDQTGRLLKLDANGEITWEKPDRRNIRSDSHQVTVELGSFLRIMGSPARITSRDGTNVFGSGCPRFCAQAMLDFVSDLEGIRLPDLESWGCSRIDVTLNYDLGNLTNVKTALEMLRHSEGGRYQVRTTAETVYWSPRSTVRSGKAYAKGPHLEYLARTQQDIEHELIAKAQQLLRLELALRRHYLTRQITKPWYELTQAELEAAHNFYFSGLIGKMEISERSDVLKMCKSAALRLGLTEGIGKAAFMSWTFIRSEGYQAWRESAPKSTFYRHKKVLLEAGLSYTDFAARNVVPLRIHRLHLAEPVQDWRDLKQAA
jgi:II/X family phage/plasmid replication protein